MQLKDHYQTLRIPVNTSIEFIKGAYRRLVNPESRYQPGKELVSIEARCESRRHVWEPNNDPYGLMQICNEAYKPFPGSTRTPKQ